LIASAAVVAPLTGCAADDDTEESGDALTGSTFDVKMPAGSPYKATITTNGSTACPRGDTLSAALAADGSTLKLVFASYTASVAKNQASKSVDCALQVVVKSSSDEQAAVSSVAYTGYSTLDKSGMVETHTATASFAGSTAPVSSNELDVRGPVTGTYSFKNAIANAQQGWSTCGSSSTLNATLKMNLANNSAKTGTGSLDPASHGVKHTLTIGLAHKACSAVVDAGTVDPSDAGDDPARDAGGIDPNGRDSGVVIPDVDGGVLPPIDFDAGGFPIPTPRGR
jgi:hypothetical protein